MFVQTDTFGGIVTRVISDIAQKKAQADIKIKKISLSFFPPGLELKQVQVAKNFSPGKKLYAEVGNLGFYLSLIELEEKKLAFGEIKVDDAFISFIQPESKEELKEIDREIINRVFDFSKNLPLKVDTLLIENSKILLNDNSLEARRVKLFHNDDNFVVRLHLANIKLPFEDRSIDEVWADCQVGRNNITIDRLKVQHDVQAITVKGEVKDYYRLKKAKANLVGESNIHLKSIISEFSLSDKVEVASGVAHVDFKLDWIDEKIKGNVTSEVENFKSNFIHAEKLNLGLEITEKSIDLTSLSLSFQKEKIQLTKKVSLMDVEKGIFQPSPVTVELQSVSLKNLLRFSPGLKVLNGNLSGRISFNHSGKDLFINPHDNFTISDFIYAVGSEKPYEIINIKKGTLTNSEFSLVNNIFKLTSNLKLPRSELKLKGEVDSKKMLITAPDSTVDLEDFGNIAQIDIKGAGKLSLSVGGPFGDIAINLAGKTKGFEVLGYRLGETEKDITIDLKDSNVIIGKMESLYGVTRLSGSGAVNYDNLDIALDINTDSTNFHDLSQILYPIFKNMDFLPKDLDFSAKVDAGIYGKTKLDKLIVKANVKFQDLIAWQESLKSGTFSVGMSNQTVSIDHLDAEKDNGTIMGDFSINLPSDKMRLNYSWENLSLGSFKAIKSVAPNLSGKISGKVSGEGTGDNLKLNLNSRIFDTRAQDYKFEDSTINFQLASNKLTGSANLLGGIVNSNFNLVLKGKSNSDASFRVAIPDLKPTAVAFLGQHLNTEDLSGKIFFDLNTKFNSGMDTFDLNANLKELVIKHEDLDVKYQSSSPQFIIEENRIKAWNLNLKQKDLYLTSKGSGKFGERVSLSHEVHFNAKLLELLVEPIMAAEGFIRNIIHVEGRGKNYDLSLTSKASSVAMTIENVPFPIKDLNYQLDYSHKRLVIHDLSSAFDNGTIAIKGDVFFDGEDPDVNIKYILDRAELPILGKSAVNLTGDGILLGNSMPYNLNGDIVVNKAQILNELDEFGAKSGSTVQIRYLPKNQESALSKMLNLNLNVKADNPIRITNSLMDVALKGELHLTGSPTRPKADGRLFSPINSSRIFFKNNEYLITNADINFSPQKEISNPSFDVQAITTISQYKVYPKAYGDTSRFNFDLTSDPPLPRDSILSLIAFGYTDELQSTLRAEEKQNLTQVGVGSFVLDRFKISDILNKQFGLQIYLGTVFEQRDSLLQGRTQEGLGGGTVGRTRSATKIELKKRLDEALSLSVSSTMGGSIGQRQSMNLNYSVNKKVQLEGVYEIRTNAEGEENIIDNNSIGGDVKFRWTFK